MRKFNQVFLIGLFGGVGARLFAILLDGVPHWAFLAFLVVELATGVLVVIQSQQTLREP